MSVGLNSAVRRHHAERILKRMRRQYIDWGGFDLAARNRRPWAQRDDPVDMLERIARLRRTTKCMCNKSCCAHRRESDGPTLQEHNSDLEIDDAMALAEEGAI